MSSLSPPVKKLWWKEPIHKSELMWMVLRTMATRVVTCLSPTSTILAFPLESKWLSCFSMVLIPGFQLTNNSNSSIDSGLADSWRNSSIAEMSPHVVDREGPRLCGEYTLTDDDVLNARRFPDGTVRNAWPIEFWDQEKGPSYRYLSPGEYHEIPLRCLKAQDISNCWCAGRCISATREALASTRVIGTCIALGEEAGREAAQHV